MTKTLTIEYGGETIVLEDRTVDTMALCFANPSWRVIVHDRGGEWFKFRLMHGEISVDDTNDDKLIFDYGCVCMVPPKRSIYTWKVVDLMTGENLDDEIVATVFRPIFRQVTKQLKEEIRRPFLDQEYMEKYLNYLTSFCKK